MDPILGLGGGEAEFDIVAVGLEVILLVSGHDSTKRLPANGSRREIDRMKERSEENR
jgi:hypothetical protein